MAAHGAKAAFVGKETFAWHGRIDGDIDPYPQES